MINVATVCREICIWWFFYKATTHIIQWRITIVMDNNTELREIQIHFYYSKSSISKRSNVWQKNIGLKIYDRK